MSEDEKVCKQCGGRIAYNEEAGYWDHLDGTYRHIAMPGLPPSEQLKQSETYSEKLKSLTLIPPRHAD